MKLLIAVMITRFIMSLFVKEKTNARVKETKTTSRTYDPATYRTRIDEYADRL